MRPSDFYADYGIEVLTEKEVLGMLTALSVASTYSSIWHQGHHSVSCTHVCVYHRDGYAPPPLPYCTAVYSSMLVCV